MKARNIRCLCLGLANVVALAFYFGGTQPADASLQVFGYQPDGQVQIYGSRLAKGDRILIYQFYYKEYFPYSEFGGTVVPKTIPIVEGTVTQVLGNGVVVVKPDKKVFFPASSKIRAKKL